MLIFLIVAIFTISAVSAEDSNQTDAVAIDDVNEDNISVEHDKEVISDDGKKEDVISLEGNDELSAGNDSEVLGNTYYPTNFDDLKSKISIANAGDTIVLSGTYLFSSQITLNKKLNFISTTNAIFDGRNSNRLFEVNTNGVTFKGITFQNGHVNNANAGAIYTKYSISIDNCKFINNYAGWSSGAIAIENGANYNISNSYFERNSGEYGGAISIRDINSNTKGNIYNCTFYKNAGRYSYGAVGGGNVEKCTFIENYANDGRAGAVGGYGLYTIKDCSFIRNTATKNGGAIYFEYNNGHIVNCTFDGNSAGDSGGAIFSVSNLNIENSAFESNHAEYFGGDLCYCASKLKIVNCNFSNSHGRNGGSIHTGITGEVYEEVYNILIDSCNFENIYADTYGGAIDSYGTINLKILDSNFTNCYCNNNKGGAIATDKCTDINISGCYFDSCHSKQDGGAVRFDLAKGICIKYSKFINCHSDDNGGSIYIILAADEKSSDTLIQNCNFIGAVANRGGAIYSKSSNEHKIINCTFEGCFANYGGAIELLNNGSTTIETCTFKNCSSNHGDAIHIEEGCNNVKVLNSNFKYCNYSEGSNAIDTYNSNSISIGGCEFEGCSGLYGALGFWGAVNNIQIFDSQFSNCSSAKDGGAIIWQGGNNLNINNCNFNSVHSSKWGGVVATYRTSNLNILSSNFTDCYSTDINGGAIHVNEVNTVNIKDCNFENNFADESGGSIFALRSPGININDCNFINSSSNGCGGAVSIRECDGGNISDCSFDSCYSKKSGGGFYAEKSTNIDVTDTSFVNCTSVNEGAAVYLDKGNNLKIDYCSFEDCVCENGGNSVSFSSGTSELIINNCLFDVPPQGITYHYDTILDVNNVSIVPGETGILTVRLYNVNNTLGYKPVTLTLNGKSDTRTTDKNGVVSFTVNNFVYLVNEYTAEISFDGDEINTKASKNVKVNVNSYRGNLEVTQVGKYYHDTSLTFKLTNLKSHEPIPYARFKIAFSNGHEVNLQTDKNGIANYNLDFNSGDYNFTAYVTDANVDVNTIKQNITIHSIRGNIEISQYGRIFKFKLYNPDNGDVFRNIKVNLQFSGVDTVAVKTNDEGIATYNFPESKGTYNLLVTVDGNQYMEFLPAELNNIVINTEYDPSLNDAIYSTIKFGDSIVFDYLKSGSTTLVIVGGSIGSLNVLGHPEAQWTYKNNILTVSNLAVGSYTLHLVTNPFDNYYSNEADLKITVNKVTAIVKASKITVALKKGASWKVTIVDSKTGKPIGGLKLTLKVYTGNKYVTKYVTTNPNGVATYQTNSLTKGSHKVVVSTDHEGYSLNPFTSSIKVIKQKALKFKVKIKNRKDGSTLSITVKHKNKPINGVKIRLYIYSGKKLVKKVTLKSKTTIHLNSKNKKKFKGRCGWGTNKLSAGKHKIVIKPVDTVKYGGSKIVHIKIKKSAKNKKKYARWESLI